MIHKWLKIGRGISESYQHYQVLIKSYFGAEYSFLFLFLYNLNEVVGPLQVKFDVLLSTINVVHDLVSAWQKVAVFDNNIIEFLVVDIKL